MCVCVMWLSFPHVAYVQPYHKTNYMYVFKREIRVFAFSFCALNPLRPSSDQHQISHYNINAYSAPEVARIKDMITQIVLTPP